MASRGTRAHDIVSRRVVLLQTMRLTSVGMTSPEGSQTESVTSPEVSQTESGTDQSGSNEGGGDFESKGASPEASRRARLFSVATGAACAFFLEHHIIILYHN